MAPANGVLYATAVLIWGSTWLAMTYQLGVVAPEVSLLYRYAIATVLMFGLCFTLRARWRFGAPAHLRFIGLGITLFGLNYVAAYWAQHYIPSALNALIFTSMVWLNIALSRLFFGTPITARAVFGSLMGMVGVVALFYPQLDAVSFSDDTLIGAGLGFLGAFIASVGNMISQKSQSEGLPVLGSTAWGMLYGTVFLGLFATLRGHTLQWDPDPSYLVSLLYLAVFGSVIGFIAYLKLLGQIGAHRAGYVVVMFPLVALALSIAFEGLRPDSMTLLGVVMILGGNACILTRSRAKATPVVARKYA